MKKGMNKKAISGKDKMKGGKNVFANRNLL